MKTKFLLGFLLTAILIVMTLTAVSAASFAVSDAKLSESVKSANLTFTTTNVNDTTVNLNKVLSPISDGKGHSVSLTLSASSVTFNKDSPGTVQVSYSGSLSDSFALGEFSTDIYAENNSDDN